MKMLALGITLLAFAFVFGGYHIVHKPTPEQLFGCKFSEVTPSGECP
jgi:hypothetical protein